MRLLKANETGLFGILIEHDAGYISPEDSRNHPFINEMKKLNSGKSIIAEPLVLFAVLQKHGVENRNKRWYPKEILEREAERYQKLIQENRAIGENNHPADSIINSERVSHNILETWWEGKTLMGKVEIIMSPGYINFGIISCQGDHVANLLRKGIMIGVSSRGVGSLKDVDGKNMVQDDFELICWDIVTSPSTPGSWVFQTKEESKPFVESTNKEKTLIENNLDKFLLD